MSCDCHVTRLSDTLPLQMTLDPVNAGVTRPEFSPPPPSWDPVCELELLTNFTLKLKDVSQTFSYTQMPFYVSGLRDTEDYVKFITDSRSIIERYNAISEVSVYPRGIPYIYWEQYFGLRTRVLLACVCILIVSLLATSFFLMDIWSAILLTVFLGMTAVEVFGFMGWIDIRFSAIPAVTLIVSVGVAVEATAPMSLYFLKACGTHNQRMHQALKHRFTPILNGGISTFLGIIMLAFSPFPFITKYFFVLLLSCIVFSLLNGLILLPVVLSLVGPPPQVRGWGKSGSGREGVERGGSSECEPCITSDAVLFYFVGKATFAGAAARSSVTHLLSVSLYIYTMHSACRRM